VDEVPPTNATGWLVRLKRQHSPTVVEHWERPLIQLIERNELSWLGRFHLELSKFASLPVGWNSYDAPPPGGNSIEAAYNFLSRLAEMPDVTLVPSRIAPIAEGGVAVSFLKNNFRASLDFLDSGEVVAIVARRGSESDVWDVESSDELQQAIHRIHSALLQS
jgi:hypothetical protein